MRDYNRIKITHRLSGSISIDYVYLMSKDISEVTPEEMANTLLHVAKKQISSLWNGTVESSIKIDSKSYKRVPGKYIVI